MLSEEGMGNHSIRGWGGGPCYLKVIWRTILFEKFSTTDQEQETTLVTREGINKIKVKVV